MRTRRVVFASKITVLVEALTATGQRGEVQLALLPRRAIYELAPIHFHKIVISFSTTGDTI